ncbi:hypothetical protein [Haloplanus sp.]|nr:hypothetical protein [Haloplanus sp.]
MDTEGQPSARGAVRNGAGYNGDGPRFRDTAATCAVDAGGGARNKQA